MRLFDQSFNPHARVGRDEHRRQGFSGNLSAAEILNQIYSLPERDTLTNVVFMGQGEPMDNYEHMLRATQVLTSDYGWAWSPKRITVSTVGVKQKVERLLLLCVFEPEPPVRGLINMDLWFVFRELLLAR